MYISTENDFKIKQNKNLWKTTQTINFQTYHRKSKYIHNEQGGNLFDHLKDYRISTELDRKLLLGIFENKARKKDESEVSQDPK